MLNIGKKISFLGDIGVGKTTLLNQIIDNKRNSSNGDSKLHICSKNVPVDDNMLLMSFWDLGTHVSKDHIPASYYISSDMVLYVFDVNNPDSFLQIEQDVRIISEVNPKCMIKLIGNKVDLDADFNEELWIKKYQFTPHYFINSRNYEEVKMLEREIIFEFLSHHPELMNRSNLVAYA